MIIRGLLLTGGAACALAGNLPLSGCAGDNQSGLL